MADIRIPKKELPAFRKLIELSDHDSDLKKLKAVIERAEKKSEALKEILRQSKIKYLEPRS